MAYILVRARTMRISENVYFLTLTFYDDYDFFMFYFPY